MPKSAAEWEKVLEKLRKKYGSDIDAIAVRMGLISKFSDQVAAHIERIKNERLNYSVVGWGERCKKARKMCGLSQSEVANILEVSRKAIQDQENLNEATTVSLFYLEAFSLVYHLQPTYFIPGSINEKMSQQYSIPLGEKAPSYYEEQNRKNPPTEPPYGISPISFFKETPAEDGTVELDPVPKSFRYMSIIFIKLCFPPTPDSLNHLQTIASISCLHSKNFEALSSYLPSIPFLKKQLNKDPLSLLERDYHNWLSYPFTWLPNKEKDDPPTFEMHQILTSCYNTIIDMKARYSDRFELLAKLSLITDETVRAMLASLCEIYKKTPNSYMETRNY